VVKNTTYGTFNSLSFNEIRVCVILVSLIYQYFVLLIFVMRFFFCFHLNWKVLGLKFTLQEKVAQIIIY